MGYLLIAFSLASAVFVSATVFLNPQSDEVLPTEEVTTPIDSEKTPPKLVNKKEIEDPTSKFTPNKVQPIEFKSTETKSLENKNTAQEKQIAEQNRLINHLHQQNQQLAHKNSQLAQQNKIAMQQLTDKDADIASINKAHQQELALQPQKKNTDVEDMKSRIETQPDLITSKTKKEPKLEEVNISNGGESSSKDKKPSLWDNFSGLTEFGFSYEKDNKTKQGLEGRLMLDYTKKEKYRLNSDFEFEFEDEDDVETKNKSRWQFQADYNLDPISTVFGRADLNNSRHSSYNKEYTFAIGYGHTLIDNKSHFLLAEIGPAYRSAKPNSGKTVVTVNEALVRLRVQYNYIFTDNLEFKFDSTTEIGNENNIYTSIIQAQNKIYRELYLVFEFEYKYTENVPDDTVNDEYTSGLKLLYAF